MLKSTTNSILGETTNLNFDTFFFQSDTKINLKIILQKSNACYWK